VTEHLRPPHPGCQACKNANVNLHNLKGDLGDVKKKLINAERSGMPDRIRHFVDQVDALKAERTAAIEVYDQHYRTSHASYADSADPFAKSPVRHKVELPPMADVAAMVREGETVAEIAETFERAESSLRSKLTDAGWSAATGEPMAKSQDDDDEGAPVLALKQLWPPWMEDAVCAQTDPESFFPEKGGSTREAKKVCLTCDVREQCLKYALDNDERFGIWGGLSERERRKLKKADAAQLDPPAPSDTPQEVAMPTPQEPTQPSYVEQIIAVMAATEGHPDLTVRAARKVVANALVALNKALRDSETGAVPLAAVPTLAEVPPKSPAGKAHTRVSNSKRIGERIAELGITAAEIRAWAVQQGMTDVPTRGALGERYVDAYVAAHTQRSTA
jgi:WhiB family redox-sensing transcriptional regulator